MEELQSGCAEEVKGGAGSGSGGGRTACGQLHLTAQPVVDSDGPLATSINPVEHCIAMANSNSSMAELHLPIGVVGGNRKWAAPCSNTNGPGPCMSGWESLKRT